MKMLSRFSFMDALDLIERGQLSAAEVLRVASYNRMLARAPLSFRLTAIKLFKDHDYGNGHR